MRAFSCFCYFILFCALNSGIIFKSFALDKNEIRTKNYYYIVKDGDNLFRIGLKYNVKPNILAEVNHLKNDRVYVGQKLKLPDGVKVVDDLKSSDNGVMQKEEDSMKKNDDKKTNKPVKEHIEKNIKNTNNTNNTNNEKNYEKQKNIATEEQNKQTKMFVWPIKGQIISKFNSLTSSGSRNLGVYIASRQGEKVKSISDGIVKFVGYVDGFDTVIIIKHYNGYYSAYGLVEPNVSIDDKVKQGQIIADITPKKESKRKVLYFSIRKNNKSYNPEEIIGNNSYSNSKKNNGINNNNNNNNHNNNAKNI